MPDHHILKRYMDIFYHSYVFPAVWAVYGFCACSAFHKHYWFIFFRTKTYVTASKSLTFKFNFDIIIIEHRTLSFFVGLINYNFGVSYDRFQYLFFIYPTIFREVVKSYLNMQNIGSSRFSVQTGNSNKALLSSIGSHCELAAVSIAAAMIAE